MHIQTHAVATHMLQFTWLDVIAPVTFILLTACMTFVIYMGTRNPDLIMQEFEMVVIAYGYTNACVGFIVGYAILRSFVETDYLEHAQKQTPEYICHLCSVRTPLL